MAKAPRTPSALPSREDLLAYIREHPGRISRRDIARAFRIKGGDRTWLRETLKDLEASGALEREGKRVRAPESLPEVTVVEIAGRDTDGEILARPIYWPEGFTVPTIFV